METKLSWQEIERKFDKEWVELTDFEWPEDEINPRSGVVRVHAKSRAEFDQLVGEKTPIDSALVFVGEPTIPDNVIISTFNTITLKPVNA